MAFTEFHYYSETLEIDVSVNVILPETRIMAQQEGKPLPTLYLLHGLSDDHTHWVRQTRLEFYARKYRLAIIMPCVNRSFYTDMKRGAKYFTFVSEELPRVMEMYFPLSSRREDRFAAGLSMGGYGATKLGLRLPERYAAIASLSGALPPLPSGLYAPGAVAYDMMYGRGDTPFMAAARTQGAARVADGLGMLVEQAAESFTLWRGVRPDTAAVLAELRRQLDAG